MLKRLTWFTTGAIAGVAGAGFAKRKVKQTAAQLAPSGLLTSVSACGGPPLTETFFSAPSAKKPSHWPSGEKNGMEAPSVPTTCVAVSRSIAMTLA